MEIHARAFMEAEEIFREFGVKPEQGLDPKVAAARLKKYGGNTLSNYVNPWRRILVRQLASPFMYLLAAAALFAWLLHEKFDALFILFFIALNTALGFFQEYRSEKTLRRLRDLIVPTSRVRRGGNEEIVPTTALVPGDILLLRAGDVIPADMRIISARHLAVDESTMSGEAFPVEKTSRSLKKGANALTKNLGFAATVVVQGEGEGIVYATGKMTNVGSIAGFIARTSRQSAFQKHIARLSTFILYLVLVTLGGVFLLNLLLKGPEAKTIELIIFSIALAVSVVPEALPLVMTFSFSRGARKLAAQKVVVKRLSSVEDLGNVEILCTDKTGTLTENVLRVANVMGDARNVLACAARGSDVVGRGHGPFDAAIFVAISKHGQYLHDRLGQERFYPFDPVLKLNGAVIKEGEEHTLIIRGAPEQILEACAGISAKEHDDADAFLVEEGRKGRRVIGIARRAFETLPKNATLKELSVGMTFIGLVSFEDPVKKTAEEAIQRAKRLGIQIKVITGDRPEVAGAIAEQVGLTERADVMTGDDFDALSETEQLAAAMRIAVFARMNPMQKAQVIDLLQRTHTVAFLGDGINDAPGLKIANVSMAVKEASDIAREAADIVLLKKDLHVIVNGIREGRIIFANTTTYLKSTLASNFGNFYSIAILSLFVNFLPLLPVQILLVNLLTDLPLTAISTDEVERAELQQPKHYDIRNILLVATLLGGVSSLFDFIAFGIFIHADIPVLQTALFMESVLTELLLLFSIRSRRFFIHARPPSFMLTAASIGVFLATAILPFTSVGHTYFHLASLTSWQGVIVLGLVGAYFLASELVKLGYYTFMNGGLNGRRALPLLGLRS
ncbi:cation-transporting P-type ATPase [candidate division WWE3 bacterium]|uniref:Cation-transporting P-type ATPase n=1 Tax=candidate division WWE3 bacterium TaxID=2053526 RepID=A0A928Y540_UNCKA|nr:cation-transporting P-type ATPase [candidate division WWE3 bacterium]